MTGPLEQLIRTDVNLREVLTSPKNHFHIETKNQVLEIVLNEL